MRVLALSSSSVGGRPYLSAAAPMIQSFLGDAPLQIAFVPFAAVDADYEAYVAKVKEGLSSLPHVINVVRPSNASDVVEKSDAIMVGGGNTFKLLHDIYHYNLFSLIQQKVTEGIPYIGWSAGANLTGKTICTTNDMPVIQPQSFNAFGFLPFQINPHYHNVVIEGFHGETRDQRLMEFLWLHPGVPIVGLPEGTALHLEGGALHLLGLQPAVLFLNNRHGQTPFKKELPPGTDFSFLLR
jgi:dipeptidase E